MERKNDVGGWWKMMITKSKKVIMNAKLIGEHHITSLSVWRHGPGNFGKKQHYDKAVEIRRDMELMSKGVVLCSYATRFDFDTARWWFRRPVRKALLPARRKAYTNQTWWKYYSCGTTSYFWWLLYIQSVKNQCFIKSPHPKCRDVMAWTQNKKSLLKFSEKFIIYN